MPRFRLRIANADFTFGLTPLFLIATAVATLMVFVAYVEALHASVRQGEAFRQSQSVAVTTRPVPMPDTDRRARTPAKFVLVSR